VFRRATCCPYKLGAQQFIVVVVPHDTTVSGTSNKLLVFSKSTLEIRRLATLRDRCAFPRNPLRLPAHPPRCSCRVAKRFPSTLTADSFSHRTIAPSNLKATPLTLLFHFSRVSETESTSWSQQVQLGRGVTIIDGLAVLGAPASTQPTEQPALTSSRHTQPPSLTSLNLHAQDRRTLT
jgi:hypothetical protein